MSKAEILDELPKLKPVELAEIQCRIEELASYGADGWLANSDLTDSDKDALHEAIEEYKVNPTAGSSWKEVFERVRARLKS